MTLRGLSKRRNHGSIPELRRRSTTIDETSPLSTPPPSSRCSEPLVARTELSRSNSHIDRVNDVDSASAASLLQQYRQNSVPLELLDHTFEDLRDREREEDSRQTNAQHRRQRSHDDYGIAYSCYGGATAFSMPGTPEGKHSISLVSGQQPWHVQKLILPDDCQSLDWDWESAYDPLSMNGNRRSSLVLDPAAFESTPSVNTVPQSPGNNATIRLKKSAEALKEFGRKVLPHLRFKAHCEDNGLASLDFEREYPARRTPRSRIVSSPATTCLSSPNETRSRSNTLDSTRSSQSIRSKPSITNCEQPDLGHSRTTSEDLPDLMPSLLPYRPMPGLASPLQLFTAREREDHTEGTKALSTPPIASPSIATTALTTLMEQDVPSAPKIAQQLPKLSSLYNATDPDLEEIMRQMQEEDEAFQKTEQTMRTSGWSSEHDIDELRQRRNEQQNLWQRRLDDALDQVKANISLD